MHIEVGDDRSFIAVSSLAQILDTCQQRNTWTECLYVNYAFEYVDCFKHLQIPVSFDKIRILAPSYNIVFRESEKKSSSLQLRNKENCEFRLLTSSSLHLPFLKAIAHDLFLPEYPLTSLQVSQKKNFYDHRRHFLKTKKVYMCYNGMKSF